MLLAPNGQLGLASDCLGVLPDIILVFGPCLLLHAVSLTSREAGCEKFETRFGEAGVGHRFAFEESSADWGRCETLRPVDPMLAPACDLYLSRVTVLQGSRFIPNLLLCDLERGLPLTLLQLPLEVP